jgi:hypothetical protein
MRERTRSRTRSSSRSSSRRGFLLKAAGAVTVVVGGGISVVETQSFTVLEGERGSNFAVASDGDGVVGIVGQGDVQKNTREVMVKLTNNSPEELTITLELETHSDGTLYDNEGGSGSAVTFTLLPGNSQYVDISATIEGTIPYSVSATSSDLTFETTRTVESVGGNANDAVRVSKVQNFQVNAGAQNNWTVDQIQVEDRDGDDDLDRVEYEIVDSDGNVRATRTDASPGAQYQESGLTIEPDDPSYDIVVGEAYTLTVTGYDVDGNFDSETVNDTATGGGNDPTAVEIKKVQKYAANAGGQNNWTIKQVQVQDRDDDDDLDRVEYEVADSNGTVRATMTEPSPGAQYQASNLTIEPDDPSYDLVVGESYTLTVVAYDADGNYAIDTRQSTA